MLFAVLAGLGAVFIGIALKETKGLNDAEKKALYTKFPVKPTSIEFS